MNSLNVTRHILVDVLLAALQFRCSERRETQQWTENPRVGSWLRPPAWTEPSADDRAMLLKMCNHPCGRSRIT